ncbi:uncharacterized protein LOC129182207 isoform X2 [Dunckerocampus dactyliophorus]|uniref:uncharacterized protein LOC129182207 isoform X2 n=1 Tax=Dunckerocampus dactyliophorus TaxID=161453 RepID=UPI00240557A6|nr:uncharacterized protein LOC129182207 isoform X2 [Dunckerocampus dactyliophorus]
MPQYSTDFVDTRRQAHENISRANGPNIQAQGVLKKASVLNGCLSGRTQPAVKSNFTKPPYVLNGYLKHGFKGDDNKAAPARTHEKQRNTFSAVCGPALAGRGSHGSAPCGILVNGTSRGHHVLTTSKPQATGFGPPATIRVKNQRWGRKKGHKKRRLAQDGGFEVGLLPALNLSKHMATQCHSAFLNHCVIVWKMLSDVLPRLCSACE